MLLLSVLFTVLFSAAVTRFVRRSRFTAGLRDRLSARSRWWDTLFSCPHCLCFWTSLACAGVLARSWLHAGILVLLGWRGAYYANRLLDRILSDRDTRTLRDPHDTQARQAQQDAPAPGKCRQCGRSLDREAIQRQGEGFCSHRCWFDFLRDLKEEGRRQDTPAFDAQGNPSREEFYLGGYVEIDALQAYQALSDPQPWTYLDVRTPVEFAQGHPPGALNVPLYLRERNQLVPNVDFVRVVTSFLARDTPLVLGDGVGSRARDAARLLVGAGYTRIALLEGGFRTRRNLAGEVVSPGWAERDLPVEYSACRGDYDVLRSAGWVSPGAEAQIRSAPGGSGPGTDAGPAPAPARESHP